MKKLITVVAVCCILLAGLFFWVAGRGFAPHTGTYLECENGSHMVVMGKSPIIMSSKNISFDGLASGDRILILHDVMEETYPARTGVYFLLKIGTDGTVDESVLQQLSHLGWQINYP